MKKLLIFAAGMVVGAAVGTTVTVLAYQKEKKKWAEKSEEEPKKPTYEDAVSTSPEELVDYYIQQLIDLGIAVDREEIEYEECDDGTIRETSRKRKSLVNPVEDDEEDEDDEDNSENEYYPIEANPNPYEIVEREFGNQEFYDSETLIWYRGDETMCSADDLDLIIDWQMHIGDVTGRLNGCKGDTLYFRNEVQQTDYEVKINKDSYKHAVEGEDDEDE